MSTWIWVSVPEHAKREIRQVAIRQSGLLMNDRSTIVMDGTHDRGVYRGLVGEWAACRYLGVEWLARNRSALDDEGWDLVSPAGRRTDVKTTSWGNGLMIPRQQMYKVDRVDALLLAYYENTNLAELAGWISAADFKREAVFNQQLPIPAMVVPAVQLRSLAPTWL